MIPGQSFVSQSIRKIIVYIGNWRSIRAVVVNADLIEHVIPNLIIAGFFCNTINKLYTAIGKIKESYLIRILAYFFCNGNVCAVLIVKSDRCFGILRPEGFIKRPFLDVDLRIDLVEQLGSRAVLIH